MLSKLSVATAKFFLDFGSALDRFDRASEHG
jgi:hypothetical protein